MNQIPNRLLIIDDEAAICDFISTVAEKIGYEVRATDDPDEFLSLLDEFRPSTLIIDLNMPKVDGIELLGILGAKQYQGAIMVISGAEARVLAAAKKSGTSHGLKMLGVVQKPISLSDLRDTLQAARTMQRVVTESDLREALELGQLTIHYQPIVARQDNDEWRIAGAEALARWQHTEFGLLKSDEFITLAEEAGLISAVTDYVFRTVVEQMHVWHDGGMDVGIAVNVASELMSDPDFPDRLMVLFEEYRVDSSRLTIEVSEYTAMQAAEHDLDVLARLRLKGVQLSIDNFGTGHSSLSQLFRLPFSQLKIDRLFVMEISSDAEARAIVRASINLAHNLNMRVCATGVHSREIWDFLDAEGCDTAQGYFFSKPVSAASFEKLFHERSGVAGAENPNEPVPAVGS
ncbi:MAG: EAL domain-containing protein [Woeseia sp.]